MAACFYRMTGKSGNLKSAEQFVISVFCRLLPKLELPYSDMLNVVIEYLMLLAWLTALLGYGESITQLPWLLSGQTR